MKLIWIYALGVALASARAAAVAGAGAPSDTNAPAGFQLQKGFRFELVAAEPLVFDPVALAFDEDGRLFVAEMRDYPGPDSGTPHQGRVRLLLDNDGDGRFDTSKDFADDLPSPSALLCYNRGVFVAAGTDILHLKDTDGDGRADTRKVVFTGFTNSVNEAGLPALVRGFTWGWDNRIHAAAGGMVGRIAGGDASGAEAVELNARDFSFHPHALVLVVESHTGSEAVSFDTKGRKFVCGGAHALRQVMWDARYTARNPFHALPPPLAELTGPASATPIFPLRAVELSEAAPPDRAPARRVVDYFSAASSLLVYRGNAFPPAYSEDVFVADARANVVRRFKLRVRGVESAVETSADARGTEFLATTNTWFRPMHLAAGPDGAIYVADLHREFVDPPETLPDALRAAAELRRGNDGGRIYRIVPENFKQPSAPKFSQAKTYDLAVNLAHLNGWHRDAAARLLCERNDRAAVPLLSNIVQHAKSPAARAHALAVLDSLGALPEAQLARCLRDTDERVRELALRFVPGFASPTGGVSDALWSALRPLATDVSPTVRYQLAFTLGGVSRPGRAPLLAEILQRNADSDWTRAAVLNAVVPNAAELLALLVGDGRFRTAPDGLSFLRELASQIGTRNDPTEVALALRQFERFNDIRLALTLIAGLDQGLRRAGSTLPAADRDGRLSPVCHEALVLALGAGVEESLRVEAIRATATLPFSEVGDGVLALVSPLQSERVQLAALAALQQFNEPKVGLSLVQRWPGLPPLVRRPVLDVLLARPAWAEALLGGIENGQIPRAALASAQVAFLLSHREPAVAQRAAALFGPLVAGDRGEARKRAAAALPLSGQSPRGRPIYLARCADCHRFRGDGFSVGPDLEPLARRGKEWLLTHLVDPNRAVSRNGASYAVETMDVGSLLGVIEDENATGLTLRRPRGERLSLPHNAISSVRSQEMSAMPEGLEEGLAPQALADLLEYLMAATR